MRGFAQHVLPRGMQKIRHYGWMGANHRISLDEVRWLVTIFLGWVYWLASGYAPQEQSELAAPPPPKCPVCGGPMRRVQVVLHDVQTLVGLSNAYWDSS